MRILLFSFYLLISATSFSQKALYNEQYRPGFHFSPAKNWCNDPNGLLYYKGTYHLFYQHNPFGNVWGHMTWGHATSKDLIHWKHLPIAIPEEKDTMIFSGTCVADINNTSGFGKNGKTPLVAIYTGHIENVNQSQHLAYSLDDGLTWIKYNKNPILDLHKKDFRDPKVFWYAPKKYWVMCVMLPVEHIVQFYSSKNLLDWNHLSDFGPAGDTSGVWECPDLVQVPIEGMPGKKTWLLQMSMNASMQYFIGEFDGVKFYNHTEGILRPDYGPDYYAAITYNQLPDSLAPVAIGWVNNWYYANKIPTRPWKGAMSLPRTLQVKREASEWKLIQYPVRVLASIATDSFSTTSRLIGNKINFDKPDDDRFYEEWILPVKGRRYKLECTLETSLGSISGLRIAKQKDQYLEIRYNSSSETLTVDRSKCGNSFTDTAFKQKNVFEQRIPLKKNTIKLEIFFDNSIAEIFVNGGETVFTTQIFTPADANGISFFSRHGSTLFSNIKFYKLKSAW